MIYTAEEVYDYVSQEDVKFIRLAFCDPTGKMKNVSIMPEELPKAFVNGIGFDASAIEGFGTEVYSDLLLFPIPSTLTVLPWRPSHGKVVRMFLVEVFPKLPVIPILIIFLCDNFFLALRIYIRLIISSSGKMIKCAIINTTGEKKNKTI